MSLRMVFVGAGIAAAVLIGYDGTAYAKSCSALKGVDTDKDGSIDLTEAQKAAAAVFDKIEKDSDKTIDAKEAKGRLSKKELAAGDPDKDGTLTKDEYLALVAKRFSAANPDADGTLDCRELSTNAGKALLKLLR
jgi:hypothetical protein